MKMADNTLLFYPVLRLALPDSKQLQSFTWPIEEYSYMLIITPKFSVII